ncbi:decaprenyl-phosphate phosphoribosyltransferase [Flavobacterium pectinovorum]|uniref:Decaprenyl-phosphate phosphoribosyltransferase n=1 Tax=Flavobacterium pectinovorum TaxID=29533 RepID=A0A502EX86_9FLAO|nr:decaprenyl-phosphate phosphoribosyltransferase [Flavobacterium pectinovorum]TPG41654.1 decaprenyl-phosphate phosphoribosyltransferase [Flavobacterium pectinovorum]
MKNYLNLIRFDQYLKNLFVFAPLFFGREFLYFDLLLKVFLTFLCFCITSSGIYILNDLFDIEEDKAHPEKSKRPIASGKIKPQLAIYIMVLLIIASLLFSFLLSIHLFFIIASYILLNFLYSKWLKHIAILDINIIALGFVLRLLAGTAVTEIILSIWILLMTYLLALFLGIAKRRTDVVLAQDGLKIRKNVEGYNLVFIDTILGILSSMIIVCYIFYCISPEVQKHYNSHLLYVSIIFVINGIFRYLKLALVDQSTYSPTKIVLKDRFIQIMILCWILLMSYLLYIKR